MTTIQYTGPERRRQHVECDMACDTQTKSWHLKKEVPIAMIVTLLIQTGGIIWWARGQEARDAESDRRLTILEKARETDKVAERMVVLETRVTELLRISQRIEERVFEHDGREKTPRK